MKRKIVIGVIVLVVAFGAFLALGIFQFAKRDAAKWDYVSFNEVVIGLRNYKLRSHDSFSEAVEVGVAK